MLCPLTNHANIKLVILLLVCALKLSYCSQEAPAGAHLHSPANTTGATARPASHQDLNVYGREWTDQILIQLASFLCELARDQSAADTWRSARIKRETNATVGTEARTRVRPPNDTQADLGSGSRHRRARKQAMLGLADGQLASSDGAELSNEGPQVGEQESSAGDEYERAGGKYSASEESVQLPVASSESSAAELEGELDAGKSAARRRHRLAKLANQADEASSSQIPSPEHNPFKWSRAQLAADQTSYLAAHEPEQTSGPRVGDQQALAEAARREDQSARLRRQQQQQSQSDSLGKHLQRPEQSGADLGEEPAASTRPSQLVRSTSAPYATMDELQLRELLARQPLHRDFTRQPSSVYSLINALNQQQQAARTHLPLVSDAPGPNVNMDDLIYLARQSSTRRPARSHKSQPVWPNARASPTNGNNQLLAQLSSKPAGQAQYPSPARIINEPMLDTYADSSAQYSPATSASLAPAHSQILGLIRASPMTQAGLASQLVAGPLPYAASAGPSRRLTQNKLPYQNSYIPLAYSASSIMPLTSASTRYARLASSSQRQPAALATAHRIGRVADSATNYDDPGSPSSNSPTTSASSDPMWSDTQNQQDDYQQSPQTIQITAVPNGLGLGGLNGVNGWGNGWNGWGGPWNGRQVLLVNRQPQVGNEWRQWVLPVAAVLALPLVLGALFVPVFLKSVMFLIQILQMLGLLMPPAQLAGHLASSSVGSLPSG